MIVGYCFGIGNVPTKTVAHFYLGSLAVSFLKDDDKPETNFETGTNKRGRSAKIYALMIVSYRIVFYNSLNSGIMSYRRGAV